MKKVIVLALLCFVAAVGWRVGNRLSADALGVTVGLLLGVMASVPTALLVLAAGRQPPAGSAQRREREESRLAYGQPSYQPPVIVLAAPQAPPQPGAAGYGFPYAALPPPTELVAHPTGPRARQFRVVGEQEETIDEW